MVMRRRIRIKRQIYGVVCGENLAIIIAGASPHQRLWTETREERGRLFF